MNKICLVIIFNHRYEGNIDILEKIYKGKFESIYYLMPFYDGNRENVIPVYESSYQFQGYVAQGLKYFWKEDYTHYLFIGDDLILNPLITQDNLFDYLNIGENSSFCITSDPIGEITSWNYENRIFNAFKGFELYSGTNYKNEILNSEDAYRKVSTLGYSRAEFVLKFKQFFLSNNMSKKQVVRFIVSYSWYLFKLMRKIQLPYPMFGGYSDIFILNKNDIKSTAKMFGVFAAMGLFVEIAIPTAMKVSCGNFCENHGGGKTMWGSREIEQMEKNYNLNLDQLFSEWPENYNFIHPIKLSKWVDTTSGIV